MGWTAAIVPNLRRHRRLLVALVLVIAVYAGLVDGLYDRTVGDTLAGRNQAYLDRCFGRARDLLVPLAIVKGTVDIIEGTTVVGVEFGDIMQPLLEYVDLAWRTVVAAAVILLATKAMLPAATGLGGLFLAAAATFWILWLLLKATAPGSRPVLLATRRVAAMCFLLAVVLYVVIPLSVSTASFLSDAATEPLEHMYKPVFERLGKIFGLESVIRAEGMPEKAERMKGKAEELIGFVQRGGVTQAAQAVFYVTVVYVLDAVVFPLGSLLLLVWIVRGVLSPALGLSSVGGAREDIRRLRDALVGSRGKEETGH